MSKHTPGPWNIGGKEYSSYGDTIILGPNDGGYHGRRIAAVEMRRNTEGGLVHEVTDANARLIAAAPELLEAIRNFLELHDKWCQGEHCPAMGIDWLRFAVKKAEGK